MLRGAEAEWLSDSSSDAEFSYCVSGAVTMENGNDSDNDTDSTADSTILESRRSEVPKTYHPVRPIHYKVFRLVSIGTLRLGKCSSAKQVLRHCRLQHSWRKRTDKRRPTIYVQSGSYKYGHVGWAVESSSGMVKSARIMFEEWQPTHGVVLSGVLADCEALQMAIEHGSNQAIFFTDNFWSIEKMQEVSSGDGFPEFKQACAVRHNLLWHLHTSGCEVQFVDALATGLSYAWKVGKAGQDACLANRDSTVSWLFQAHVQDQPLVPFTFHRTFGILTLWRPDGMSETRCVDNLRSNCVATALRDAGWTDRWVDKLECLTEAAGGLRDIDPEVSGMLAQEGYLLCVRNQHRAAVFTIGRGRVIDIFVHFSSEPSPLRTAGGNRSCCHGHATRASAPDEGCRKWRDDEVIRGSGMIWIPGNYRVRGPPANNVLLT